MSHTQTATTRLASAFLQYWWVIIVAGLVGGLLAYGYSSTLTPIYHSTASIYFSMRTASSGSDINQGSAYTQNQMLSFAQLVRSAEVLDSVRDDLSEEGVELTNSELRRMTKVGIPQNTVVLEITAASASNDVAALVANSIAENLTDVVYDIAPKDGAGASTVVARVIDPGVPASFQSSPDKPQNAIVGVLIGGLAAAFGLTVLALLDTRVRSRAALAEVTEIPVLSAVPRQNRKHTGPVMTLRPNGFAAEAYRQLRSALKFSAVEHPIGAIAVTSSVAGEGKTTTAINLALAYVESGHRVLLIDADLRRPMVATVLGLENAVGITSVLVESVGVEEALIHSADNLDVLTAGENAPNPAELLASNRMRLLIEALRSDYDLVVVDTAPVLSVSDATVISQYVDTMVAVVNARKTSKAQVERSISALEAVGANVAGFVLNNVAQSRRDSYYYASEE
ncbi:polysaccharide biosynthesis tyrosine autokinase [Microbacterium sp. MC2]